MEHWDGRDLAQAAPLRLSRRDRRRLERMLGQPARQRHTPPHAATLVGVALALGLLAGLAWALAPVSPVSPEMLK